MHTLMFSMFHTHLYFELHTCIYLNLTIINKETINLILTRDAERNGKQAVKKHLEIKNRAGVEAYSEKDMNLHFDQHEVYPHCYMCCW
jgi:hypothetical protein